MEIKNYHKIRSKIIVAIAIGVILTTIMGIVISKLANKHLNEDYLIKQIEMSQTIYQQILDDDTETMAGIITLLQNNRTLQDLFLTEDRLELFGQSKNLFDKLRDSYQITHFYYHKLNGQNFLRVHNPNRYGDKIDRFTMKQAMASQTLSSGIELGPMGTFTLRVVAPWVRDGEIIGYLELGEEIDFITREISSLMRIDLILVIHKKEISRDNWLEGQKLMGRNGDWDFLKNHAVINSSLTRLPAEFRTFLREMVDMEIITPRAYQVSQTLLPVSDLLKM